MYIDYRKNPLGIVKKFKIPYGDPSRGLYLEARIIGHDEYGFNEINWFDGEILYPGELVHSKRPPKKRHGIEINGVDGADRLFYKDLKSGGQTIMEVKKKLMKWCDFWSFKISSEQDITEGVEYVTLNRPKKRSRRRYAA